MTREKLLTESINYKGIRWVLMALIVFCVSSCASNIKEPSSKAATTMELKTISETMARESLVRVDIAKIREAIQAGADVNVRNEYGVTTLYMASKHRYPEIVKLLITAGANPNMDSKYGANPLWVASDKGYTETVKLLLKAGADPNVNPCADPNASRLKKLYCYNALMAASRKGYTEIVKLLITAGADPNTAVKYSDNPLLVASHNGHAAIVKLLLEAGANPNINWGRKAYCFTPLMAASENGHTEIVKLLLVSGADVNAPDKTEGVTPLLMTSLYGYTQIVELLLKAKADVNFMITIYGIHHTPLSVAKEMSHTDIIQLLIRYGAKK